MFSHSTLLKRATRTTHVPAQYANSTVSSTVSNGPAFRTCCRVEQAGDQAEFDRPKVVTTKLVVATAIYKVGPNNVTASMMRYNNAILGAGHYKILEAAQWNKILPTTGVTVENGTPLFVYVTTVYTAADAPFTISATL